MNHTKRQRQVLDCVQAGLSNKLIARELCIAEPTVKIYISELLQMYKAKNRTQLGILSLHETPRVFPPLDESPFCWISRTKNTVAGVMFLSTQPGDDWEPLYLRRKE